MPSVPAFKIEDGVLAIVLVDTAALGYLPTWQAPGGAEVFDVTLADYTAPPGSGVALSCVTTSGAINASPNTSEEPTSATFCGAEVTTTVVGVTSYTLDATVLQDPQIAGGVAAFMTEHDTKEAYYYLGLAGDGNPPASIGRLRIIAGSFGGDARVALTSTHPLPISPKPDFWYGDATTNRVVKGDGSTVTPTATSSSSRGRKRETVDA